MAAQPVLAQGMAFVTAALLGVVLGLFADAYRGLRRSVGPGAVAGAILDVAFVLAMMPVVAGGLLLANWGEMRAYPLLGLGGGLAAYFLLASPIVLPASTWSFHTLATGVRAVGRTALWPVRAARGPVTTWLRARRRPPGGPSPTSPP